MLHATHGHLASKNENKRQKNIWTVVRSHDRGHSGQGGLVLVCWAVCFNTQELVWWLYTHARMHTNYIHTTLTQTHAPTHARNTHTHARNTHTHTRTHACTHQYTTRPTHTLTLKFSTCTCMHTHQAPIVWVESCRACVNLCLSDLLPMRTDRWDPQRTWLI